MKKDYMGNTQLKSAYNVQLSQQKAKSLFILWWVLLYQKTWLNIAKPFDTD